MHFSFSGESHCESRGQCPETQCEDTDGAEVLLTPAISDPGYLEYPAMSTSCITKNHFLWMIFHSFLLLAATPCIELLLSQTKFYVSVEFSRWQVLQNTVSKLIASVGKYVQAIRFLTVHFGSCSCSPAIPGSGLLKDHNII